MKAFNIISSLVLLLVLFYVQSGVAVPRKAEVKKEASKLKPIRLNVDILPPFQEVLESLEFTPYLRDFVRMGVTETRLLLRLSAMDFQIMMMDWNDFTTDKVASLKKKVAELTALATIPDEIVRPELLLRKKLMYGRILLPNGVQSFEYSLASFGTPPPLGPVTVELSHTDFECDNNHTTNYHGHLVLVKRGNCTFLNKALNLKSNNASGMLVVSTEDRLESPSSGYGVDKNITEAVVASVGEFYVIQTANTSWESLQKAVNFHAKEEGKLPQMNIVPLKCHTGGQCLPLTEEEKGIQVEVSWGLMSVRKANGKGSKSFEFLTSNFGAHLPVGRAIPVVKADPVTACEPVQNISTTLLERNEVTGVGMFAHRGTCRFDIKAMHAQHAGARFLILVDVDDNALQRMGGMHPELPRVGIPSVLVTAEAATFLEEGDSVEFFPSPDNSGFEHWIEVAHTDFSENDDERLMQLQGLLVKFQETESKDVVKWLKRKIQVIDEKKAESVESDL